MTVTRTYIPWYREGFTTALAGRPPSKAGRAALPATVTLRGYRSVGLPAELAGPGDVIGLDPREVRRTEPYDGCTDFEPSYFPYLECTHPDLPWRFSPFGPEHAQLPDPATPGNAATQVRLRPWIALVVVPADAAKLTGAPPGKQPTLTTDAAQLPNASEAWAWAHVQVVTADSQTVEEALGDSTRRTARLICPRRLAARTRYQACLVPAFAAGRTAPVPVAAGGDPLAPAWGSTGEVVLPVYFQWSFTTGEAGSFETFATRLCPRSPTSLPDAPLAGRVIATDNPGWGVTGTPAATVVMHGALRPLGATEGPADPALAQKLRGAVSADRTGTQLRPPVYGQDFQGGITAVPQGGGWLAQLNTDPRRRVAAGLAAWAVTVEQEDLADRAWQQLAKDGERSRLGERLRSLREEVSGLTQEGLAQVFGGKVSMVSMWETSRRVPPEPWLKAYARLFATRRSFSGQALPRLVEDEDLTDDELQRLRALEAELLGLWAEAQASGDGTRSERHRTVGSPELAQVVGMSLGRRHTNATTTAVPAALLRMIRSGGPLSPTGLAAAAVSELGVAARAVPAFAGRREAASSEPLVAGRRRFTPRFPEPAYTFLRAVAEEWLLPGAEKIPADTVMLVQSNPEFVEAFLVGLNHAMARELGWRRFPLEPTGTMFGSFWGTQGADGGPGGEYRPVATWPADSGLGSHTKQPEQLVLLLRGALLRRFPTAAIYLSRSDANGRETHLTPNLAGTLGTDTAFYGFPLTPTEALSGPDDGGGGWFVIIQEAVHHARFGVDDPPQAGTARLGSWQDLDWGHPQFRSGNAAPVTHVPVAGPLLGLARPISDRARATATWGLSCAHLAVAVQQPAFQVRMPVALWLKELVTDDPVE